MEKEMKEKEILDGLIAAFHAKDLEAVMSYFAEDAVLFDPHYPIQRMEGKAAIRQGMEWGLGNLEKPGFIVRHFWSNGQNGAVELDTHHIFRGGMEVKFDQVFVFELADGKLKRLQSYVPYPPPGIGGFLSKMTRWAWKLKGKA